MVSKLKVVPFHRVNSPVEAPVRILLPSGVHYVKQRYEMGLIVEFLYTSDIDGASDLVQGHVHKLGSDRINWITFVGHWWQILNL